MCPKCYVKLIPIVYGRLDPKRIDLQKNGQLIVGTGKYKKGKPLSFCPLCEETYEIIVKPLDF